MTTRDDVAQVPTVDLLTVARKARASDVHHIDVAIFKKAQGDTETESEDQRVLCGCESYLAYTLKNGCALRFLERSHNHRGILKAHKNPIHMVRFVNYRSNVGASAAENELFVWVITDDNAVAEGTGEGAAGGGDRLTVRLYFRLEDRVTVYNFTFFINAAVGVPDMLLLYDKKASILESSRLIQNFTATTVASLARDSRELRELNRPAGKDTLCCNKVADWFAFTTEPTLVVTCTLRNRGTPAWAACEGDVVRSLELLETTAVEGPTTLIAASEQMVWQWSLTGDAEPHLLRRLVLGTAPLVAVLSSRNTFAVFNRARQVAMVEGDVAGARLEATVYDMDTLACPPGVHFNRTPTSGFVLVSSAKKIEMYQFIIDGEAATGSPTNAVAKVTQSPTNTTAQGTMSPTDAVVKTSETASPNTAVSKTMVSPTNTTAKITGSPSNAAPVVSTTSTPIVSDPAILSAQAATASPTQRGPNAVTPPRSSPVRRGTSRLTSPAATSALSGLIQQLERGTLKPTPPPPSVAHVDDAAAPPPRRATTPPTLAPVESAPAPPPAPAHAAGRVVLHNAALPQSGDGLLASAATQSDEGVRRELESVQTAVKNILQIAELTPSQVVRDHEQLVNLALEAQMTELQSGLTAAVAGGANGAETVTPASRNDEEAFNSFAIVKLIAPISKEIVSGVTRGIGETLRAELDNALRTALGNSVHDSQKALIKRRLDEALAESSTFFTRELTNRLDDFVKRELSDTLDRYVGLLRRSEDQNQELRSALTRLMDTSGVLDELQHLRRELAVLKEGIESGTYGPHHHDGVGANPSSFQTARPTPETMLSTAEHLLEQGRTGDGLFYIAEAGQPRLTMQLVRKLTGDSYTHAVADASVRDEVWSKILTQLSGKDVAESTEDVLHVVELMFDVLSEREALTTSKTARAQQLMSDIRHFITRVKTQNTSGEVLHALRDLEKSLL